MCGFSIYCTYIRKVRLSSSGSRHVRLETSQGQVGNPAALGGCGGVITARDCDDYLFVGCQFDLRKGGGGEELCCGWVLLVLPYDAWVCADVGGIFLFWLIWMVMVEMTQLGVFVWYSTVSSVIWACLSCR